MNLTERDKRTLTLGGIALVLLLGTYFGLIPLAQSWGEARERIASGRAELEQLQREAQVTSRQRARLVETYGPGARAALPPLEEARLTLMNDVESVMNAADIDIESIHPQAARPLRQSPHLTRVPLRIDTTCSLEALARALAQLQASERLILVERINTSAVDDRPGHVDASVELATLARTQERP